MSTALATPTLHPSQRSAPASRRGCAPQRVVVPRDRDDAVLAIAGRDMRLTNLGKPFWPALGLAKGDLLQYYATCRRGCYRISRTARW